MRGKLSVIRTLQNILKAQTKLLEKKDVTPSDVDSLLKVWSDETKKLTEAVFPRRLEIPAEVKEPACKSDLLPIPLCGGETKAATSECSKAPVETSPSSACRSSPGMGERKAEALTFLPKKGNELSHAKSVRMSTASMIFDDNKLKISIHLEDYNPEEVTVRVEGNWLVVEAIKDGWSKEHKGIIHRHLMRRYELSPNADIGKISSSMKNGKLEVVIPYTSNDIKIKHIKVTDKDKEEGPGQNKKEHD